MLTNVVLKHLCRKKLMIGYSHSGRRNECWSVKTLSIFVRRRLFVLHRRASFSRTEWSSQPVPVHVSKWSEMSRKSQITLFVRTAPYTGQFLAKEALSESSHWTDTVCTCYRRRGTNWECCHDDSACHPRATGKRAFPSASGTAAIFPFPTTLRVLFLKHLVCLYGPLPGGA